VLRQRPEDFAKFEDVDIYFWEWSVSGNLSILTFDHDLSSSTLKNLLS